MFAKYLKKLKKDQWHNSFDDLPEENNLPPDNILLLWKLDDGFTQTFYANPSPLHVSKRKTLEKSNPSPKTMSKRKSPTKNSNVRTQLDFTS
jgi:hypothetical protein